MEAARAESEARTLVDLLRNARFEVLALEGIEDEVLAHLGTDVKVTVTASPSKGLDATFGLTERLIGAGYAVEPHLCARLVRDRAHLDEILARLLAMGVRELFVLAGDAEEAGEFPGAVELLAAMGDARSRFDSIGITGYPESHHLISDEETIQAMFAKAPMATHIVSQVCFDAQLIAEWVRAVRARGTALPIWIGLPGEVDRARLLRVSMKMGLGESTRFLRHNRGWLARLFARRFTPDGLARELAPFAAERENRVAGLHLFTFNEVARTERWRRRTLEQLG